MSRFALLFAMLFATQAHAAQGDLAFETPIVRAFLNASPEVRFRPLSTAALELGRHTPLSFAVDEDKRSERLARRAERYSKSGPALLAAGIAFTTTGVLFATGTGLLFAAIPNAPFPILVIAMLASGVSAVVFLAVGVPMIAVGAHQTRRAKKIEAQQDADGTEEETHVRQRFGLQFLPTPTVDPDGRMGLGVIGRF